MRLMWEYNPESYSMVVEDTDTGRLFLYRLQPGIPVSLIELPAIPPAPAIEPEIKPAPEKEPESTNVAPEVQDRRDVILALVLLALGFTLGVIIRQL